METTLSLLSQFPTNKSSLELFVKNTKDLILSGQRDVLQFATYLASMEKIIKALRKDTDIEEAILKEAGKYGQKSFEFKGTNFTISEVGTKYDYTQSQSWLNTESKLKEHEAFLKSLSEKIVLVDENTGETIECFPPIKTSKTKVIVKL